MLLLLVGWLLMQPWHRAKGPLVLEAPSWRAWCRPAAQQIQLLLLLLRGAHVGACRLPDGAKVRLLVGPGGRGGCRVCPPLLQAHQARQAVANTRHVQLRVAQRALLPSLAEPSVPQRLPRAPAGSVKAAAAWGAWVMMLVLGGCGPLKAPAAQGVEPLLQHRRGARHLLQEAGLLQQLLLQILHRPWSTFRALIQLRCSL